MDGLLALGVRDVVAAHIVLLRRPDFTEMDLSYAPISDEDEALEDGPLALVEADAIANALSKDRRLGQLVLWGAYHNFPGSLRPFLEIGLPKHPALTYLSLAACKLTGEHAELIGLAVMTNVTVKTLTLEENLIGDRGAKAIMEGLCHNKTLESLNLEFNGIGLEGFRAIGSVLEKINLLELELEGNLAGDISAAALADGLSKNNSLTTLGLTDNDIGDEGCYAFANVIRCNSSLIYLCLSCDRCTEAGELALETSLRHTNFALEGVGCILDSRHHLYQPSGIESLCEENRRLNAAHEDLNSKLLPKISAGLWPPVLAVFETKPDLLFSILKSKPDSWCREKRPTTQRKRKCRAADGRI